MALENAIADIGFTRKPGRKHQIYGTKPFSVKL